MSRPLKDSVILEQDHRNSLGPGETQKRERSCGSICRPTPEGRVNMCSIRAGWFKNFEGRGPGLCNLFVQPTSLIR